MAARRELLRLGRESAARASCIVGRGSAAAASLLLEREPDGGAGVGVAVVVPVANLEVERDQVEDYARRKNMTPEQVEQWLAPVLGYDRKPVARVA